MSIVNEEVEDKDYMEEEGEEEEEEEKEEKEEKENRKMSNW